MKNRNVVSFITLFALAAIINCAMIEPAFACKEDFTASQSEDAHCGFVCHSAHHQWVPDNTSSEFPHIVLKGNIFSEDVNILIEPPVRSIFHPPAVL